MIGLDNLAATGVVTTGIHLEKGEELAAMMRSARQKHDEDTEPPGTPSIACCLINNFCQLIDALTNVTSRLFALRTEHATLYRTSTSRNSPPSRGSSLPARSTPVNKGRKLKSPNWKSRRSRAENNSPATAFCFLPTETCGAFFCFCWQQLLQRWGAAKNSWDRYWKQPEIRSDWSSMKSNFFAEKTEVRSWRLTLIFCKTSFLTIMNGMSTSKILFFALEAVHEGNRNRNYEPSLAELTSYCYPMMHRECGDAWSVGVPLFIDAWFIGACGAGSHFSHVSTLRAVWESKLPILVEECRLLVQLLLRDHA